MKRIFLFSLIIIMAIISCDRDITITDLLKSHDKSSVKVVSYSLIDNSKLFVEFDSVVFLEETVYKGVTKHPSIYNSTFNIPLDTPLEMGEIESFSLTASSDNGTLTRCTLRLVGRNDSIAEMVINEVSIDGNNKNPDRIELLVKKKGNTAGTVLQDGYEESANTSYILPNIEVDKGDILVIYWDKITEERSDKQDNGKLTYYLNAKGNKTLSSTKGIITLLSETDGEIMDAIVYSNDYSEEHSGMGSDKLEASFNKITELGEWSDSPIDSSLVTYSRVLARLPNGIDNNSLEDWFTTKASHSTFGKPNIYTPYIPE